MENLFQRLRILLSLLIVGIAVNFGCTGKVWKPVPNPNKIAVRLECGEERILYTNTSNKMEMLIFRFKNDCEFFAQAWVTGKDSILIASTQVTIPGRSSLQTSYELNPGNSFSALCSMVSTVANEGCEVTYWVAATK
jgi:hypothetical protein